MIQSGAHDAKHGHNFSANFDEILYGKLALNIKRLLFIIGTKKSKVSCLFSGSFFTIKWTWSPHGRRRGPGNPTTNMVIWVDPPYS